jgi:hypothetical protein
MTRTPTLPATDMSMWRQLLSRAHPDAGGSHELFIWTGAVRDLVCGQGLSPHSAQGGNVTEPRSYEDPARVPYPPESDFAALTARALAMAEEAGGVHGALLEMLTDCYPLACLVHEQERGASYKRLAAAGHMVGMTKAARVRWYRIAEAVPLSDRHVGHILARLDRRAA